MKSPDEDLKQKIILMMTFRMVIIITLLGSAILIQLVSKTMLPINPLYFLIFLTCFFTLIYAFGVNRINNLRAMAYLQLSGDVFVITLLLYFTGGVNSPFSFLYVLAIITGSILLFRRGSLLIAAMSTLFYMGLILLLFYGVVPYYDLQLAEAAEITQRVIYFNIFIHLFAFFTTAVLSNYLSERLERTSTALQELDEDLSDLKLHHEKIINSIRTGLIITDLYGSINYANEAGRQILGLPMHRIVGSDMRKIFREEIALPEMKELLKESKLLRLERTYFRGSEELFIGMNLSYLQSQKSGPYGVIFVFQDITENRKMEQQYRLQERMAAIGTMAAGIAHEIRNPLAAIHGSVQMLKDDLSLTDDQAKLLEIVLTESIRLNQTISTFLSYAKPKQLQKKVDDLKSVVDDTLKFIQKSPEFKEHHNIVFSKSLEGFFHEFDSNQMKQVIWNISINALHAMPDGGTLEVTLEHDLHGNVILSFRDEGTGMEADRLESIFDPFQTSTTGGSGLGMAIVYRIIRDHHGHISIDSKPGQGTTILLRLPVRGTQVAEPLLQ